MHAFLEAQLLVDYYMTKRKIESPHNYYHWFIYHPHVNLNYYKHFLECCILYTTIITITELLQFIYTIYHLKSKKKTNNI